MPVAPAAGKDAGGALQPAANQMAARI